MAFTGLILLTIFYSLYKMERVTSINIKLVSLYLAIGCIEHLNTQVLDLHNTSLD